MHMDEKRIILVVMIMVVMVLLMKRMLMMIAMVCMPGALARRLEDRLPPYDDHGHGDDRESGDAYGGDGDADEDNADDDCKDRVYGGGVPPTSCATVRRTPAPYRARRSSR